MADQESLRDVLVSTPRELAKLIRRLAQSVEEDTSDPSSPEVVATFKTIGGISMGGVIGSEALQGIIFEEREVVQQLPDEPALIEAAVAAPVEDREINIPPRTFGELLRTRIDDALPVGNRIQRKDLATLLQNKAGVRKASGSLGLERNTTFDRSEAITVAEKVLTTPGPRFESRDSYSRVELFQHFKLNAAALDGWSQLIGHDWKANPSVDLQTALAMRGLIQLYKITTAPRRS